MLLLSPSLNWEPPTFLLIQEDITRNTFKKHTVNRIKSRVGHAPTALSTGTLNISLLVPLNTIKTFIIATSLYYLCTKLRLALYVSSWLAEVCLRAAVTFLQRLQKYM